MESYKSNCACNYNHSTKNYSSASYTDKPKYNLDGLAQNCQPYEI